MRGIRLTVIMLSLFLLFQKVSVSSQVPGASVAGPESTYDIATDFLDRHNVLPGDLSPLPDVPVPKDNPLTPAKIELGKMLFFDPRLSSNGHYACATCHNPALAFTDGLPRALGFKQIELGRHTPTLLNVAYNTSQFWNGRLKTLEEQAKESLLDKDHMNTTAEVLKHLLNGIPSYRKQFQEVFGGPATVDRVAKAIAAFERTLMAGDSSYDRYLAGDKQALTPQEKHGLLLFVGKAVCTMCHNGPNLSDGRFHNIGTKHVGPLMVDMGRYDITKDHKDMHAFKTPTLRNIALTPPYMHDGVLETLEDVVEYYDKGGENHPHKSLLIVSLNMTAQEKKDLLAFLMSLNGQLPSITPPLLPTER